MAAIYSNGGNRWNILGFNFTKRDALSSVSKISMKESNRIENGVIAPCKIKVCKLQYSIHNKVIDITHP